MKNFAYMLLLMAAVLMAATACDEDKPELSDVAIIISPDMQDTVRIASGDKARYTVELHTLHDYVSRLCVSSFDAAYGKRELADVTFTEKQDIYYFDYTAPLVNRDSLSVVLTFEAWDNTGNKCETTRQVVVKNSAHLLDEMTGVVLRAADSNWPDAFFFANPSQTFSWQHSPDSVIADIYLVSNEDFSQLSFHSNTKAKMVRINNFDYPAATAVGLQTVYESSLRSDWVDDLRTNDIILVGHDSQAEGVLRITNIIRTGDDNERCVQLAFKGIYTKSISLLPNSLLQ